MTAKKPTPPVVKAKRSVRNLRTGKVTFGELVLLPGEDVCVADITEDVAKLIDGAIKDGWIKEV